MKKEKMAHAQLNVLHVLLMLVDMAVCGEYAGGWDGIEGSLPTIGIQGALDKCSGKTPQMR